MSHAKRGSDRRRYPRIDRTLRIRVAADREQVATETVNVSCGGTLCWLDRPMPVMAKVAVALALPKRLIHCTGVVVRCEAVPPAESKGRGRYRLALFFTDLSREDHRAVAEFVLHAMFTHANGRRP